MNSPKKHMQFGPKGAVASPFSNGVKLDLKQFYTSRLWRKVSTDYMKSKLYICEKCNNRRVMNAAIRYGRTPRMICHHIVWLTEQNVHDTKISLATENLQCLCQICHNEVHAGTINTVPSVRFDKNGQVVPKEE